MKIYHLLLPAIMSLAINGCRAQEKNGGKQPTDHPAVYKGVTNDSCAVEMAFGSPGSGIDPQAYKQMMAIVEREKLAYTAKSVGREGETRVCFPLLEVKGKKKTALISELKKIAKEGQLVSISIR